MSDLEKRKKTKTTTTTTTTNIVMLGRFENLETISCPSKIQFIKHLDFQ